MDDEVRTELRKASTLPSGYIWVMWTDGSGYLKHPDGTSSFEYDLNPYYNEGGIEYQKRRGEPWDVFWGKLDEFFKYAEKEIS